MQASVDGGEIIILTVSVMSAASRVWFAMEVDSLDELALVVDAGIRSAEVVVLTMRVIKAKAPGDAAVCAVDAFSRGSVTGVHRTGNTVVAIGIGLAAHLLWHGVEDAATVDALVRCADDQIITVAVNLTAVLVRDVELTETCAQITGSVHARMIGLAVPVHGAASVPFSCQGEPAYAARAESVPAGPVFLAIFVHLTGKDRWAVRRCGCAGLPWITRAQDIGFGVRWGTTSQ
jgi:hypothetical protein